MEFYAKVEPAGEFASGVIKNDNYDSNDICEIQINESPKNDVVRTFGLPMYLNTTKNDLEQMKEAVLNNFIDMPEENRDKINWNIYYRKPSKTICNEDSDNDKRIFTYIESSKYSVDMDFGDNIDLSNLSISITFIEFHVELSVEDIKSMWVLECIEYENEDYDVPEWEPIDRGIDLDCRIYDCDNNSIIID